MEWKKYTLKTTAETVDIISAMLNEIGIEGIEIEDNVPLSEEDKQKMFVDIMPEPLTDDGIAFIHFYLDAKLIKEDEIKILSQIDEGLKEIAEFSDIGEGSISSFITDEKDWMDNWKQFFKPFFVGESLLVKPIWEECVDIRESDIVIEINPGRAFGTGSHETTKLCMLAIMKYLKKGSIVLDIGSGSGILSITAIKLGALKVIGTDIDVTAIDASSENAIINHYTEDKALFLNANIINNDEDRKLILEKAPKGYDLVVANMLAEVIIPLAETVGQLMNDGAYFISSGIIDTKAEEVEKALIKNGFSIVETMTMGEWVSYVAIYEQT